MPDYMPTPDIERSPANTDPLDHFPAASGQSGALAMAQTNPVGNHWSRLGSSPSHSCRRSSRG